jgi:hypothetical protein
MVSMKEILDKNPKYDHKEHTKKQRDSFKRLKDKTMDKVDKVKQQVGTYGTAAIAVIGALGLGAAKKARDLKSQRFKKDYFSKKKYIDPRKVQKPDNLDF